MDQLRIFPELNPNAAWMLWEAAERFAARPAVLERDRSIDYRSLHRRAAALGGILHTAGLRPDDRVAILLDRGPDAAAAFFGAIAAGGIAVNVNETLRPRQIEHVLGHAGAGFLVTTPELLQRLPRPLQTDARILHPGVGADGSGPLPAPRIGSDVAQIIYTSGSTGLPKGVAISHANLWAGMRAVTAYVGITPQDRLASLLPFSFDYGLNQLLCAVGRGAALVVERSTIPQQIVAGLRAQEVTVLPAVPPLWLQLLHVQAFTTQPIPSLRVMTNTGGRLPTDAVRTLRRTYPDARLFLMYGLTEAFRSTYLPPEEADPRPDSIGRAIPGAEIYVLRDDGTAADPGEAGELVHRGPTVALGYWNDPAATARVFRPNPCRPAEAPDSERVVYSGDLVRRDEAGFLYYVGRRDRMIKSLGFRVSPDEVADVLYASGQVREAVVTAEPDEQRGERIVVIVVLSEHGTRHQLEAFCTAELPRYMQPSRIEVREELPRTSTGKHDVAAAKSSRDST